MGRYIEDAVEGVLRFLREIPMSAATVKYYLRQWGRFSLSLRDSR